MNLASHLEWMHLLPLAVTICNNMEQKMRSFTMTDRVQKLTTSVFEDFTFELMTCHVLKHITFSSFNSPPALSEAHYLQLSSQVRSDCFLRENWSGSLNECTFKNPPLFALFYTTTQSTMSLEDSRSLAKDGEHVRQAHDTQAVFDSDGLCNPTRKQAFKSQNAPMKANLWMSASFQMACFDWGMLKVNREDA